MKKGQFRWDLLGTPDYSECARIVASLPPHTRHRFGVKDEQLLVRLLYLCWLQAYHSGRGAAYASPGQSYLGTQVHRSRWTVARALKRLRGLGLLEWMRRRPRTGAPQSNLYTLGKRLLATIYALASKKLQRKRDGAKMPHNDLKKGEEPSGGAGQGGSITLLPETRGLERRLVSDTAPFQPLSAEKREAELQEGRQILAKFGLRPSY